MLILIISMFFLTIFMSLYSTWLLKTFYLNFVIPFMFLFNFSYFFMSKNYFFSLDLYSLSLLILTLWIILMSEISSYLLFFSHYMKLFFFSFNLLMIFLFFSFLTNNFLFFFIFFESTLLPILFIIIGWGYKIERIKSGFYMFFYTLFGSLPMISMIFFLMNKNHLLIFEFLDLDKLNLLIYFFCIFAFLIKMPMFLVHSWLPKAHVEAPVSGSMILAGILLKLGGYGIFRFFFLYKHFLYFNNLWMYISIWGGILSSLICLRQIDMKSLIAYSSISHMSMVIMGLLIYSDWSIVGSFLMMVAHGLSSSGLFFLSNVVYERSGTRSIYLNKGLISILPSMSLYWFMFCSYNMAAPPSLNLFSEIFLINSIVSWNFIFIGFLMLLSFFAGVYNLFLFSFCNHGKIFFGLNIFYPCQIREYMICFLHLVPLSLFFLKLEFFF